MTDLADKARTLVELPPPQPSRFAHLTFENLAKRFGVIWVWMALIVVFGVLKPAQFLTLSAYDRIS